MIDMFTKKKLTVTAHKLTGPHMTVPLAQMTDVCKVLDSQKVPYYVGENAISLDDEPEVVFFNFGRDVDPLMVQNLIDSHH
jgi:hypothetical protein